MQQRMIFDSHRRTLAKPKPGGGGRGGGSCCARVSGERSEPVSVGSTQSELRLFQANITMTSWPTNGAPGICPLARLTSGPALHSSEKQEKQPVDQCIHCCQGDAYPNELPEG